MNRAGILLSAFVAGVAVTLLTLYMALRTAPGVIMADDMVDALTVVAATPLSRFPPGAAVYVKSSVGPLLLEKLQRSSPALRLASYAERPADNCTPRSSAALSCERDDFLKLEVLSSPTRFTMLVAVGTSRAYGQVLLLRVLGRWRVVVDHSYPVS